MDGLEFRTIDGTGNNPEDLGAAGDSLFRLQDNAFEDDINVPRGGAFHASTLPNPRTISNLISAQIESVTNFLGISYWIWQWGQFIDHDLSLNESNEAMPGEETPIPVPEGDPIGDFLPFTRVPAAPGTGEGTGNPRETINQITAFIDASSVYGSDEERAEFLRVTDSLDENFGKGLLKTSEGLNGEILLPLNDGTQENATGGGFLGDVQFVAGDIRANEQIGLIAIHTLFVREHNRLATEFHERLEEGEEVLVEGLATFNEEFADQLAAENPNASDEELALLVKDEFFYQTTRKVVAAEIQAITYNEFLPLLIGNDLEVYEGYDSSVNPQVSTEFANAAYRLGHSLISDQLLRVDAEGNTISETSSANAFFDSEDIQANGVDTLLQGLIFQEAQEVDNLVVDGVRNFLFPAEQGGLDLASVNIARGRETGLPGYVEVHNEIFGTSIESFDDLGSDGLGLFTDEIVVLFEEAYETVEQIDLWIGGISELPDDHGGLLGPTFSFFIADQFGRGRDGDRFFYLEESQAEHLESLDIFVEELTLSEIIDRNIAEEFEVPESAFVANLGGNFESDKYASINGRNNNLENDFGVTGAQLLRLLDNAYNDGISIPRGGPLNASTLPNPRTISNIISDQTDSVTNFLGASDWIWQWGQFIDHDFDLNEANEAFSPGEGDVTPIPVPAGDSTFDDGMVLPFIRVPAAEGTGTSTNNPRETINQITAFIDASSVYGSDKERQTFLRSFVKGQLNVSIGDNGEILLSRNRVGLDALPNAAGATLGELQFVAGDIRANEQLGLIAVHTLFVREHNRLTEEIHDRLEAGEEPELTQKFEDFAAEFIEQNPTATEEEIKDEFLYQAARKVVTAKIQVITYNEFLPLLIGNDLGVYEGYDSTIDAGITTEFANAAYRLGHSLLSDQLLRVDAEGNRISEISLAEAFFNPEDIQENGVDTILQGLIFQEAQDVDNLVVDGVRDFLFPAGTGGLDLAAINIARGRETGLPGYIAVHNEIFGTNINSFDDLGSDGLGLFADEVVALFEEVYETVDQIDLWLGGISELPDDHGGLLGPTFSFFIADQFGRGRDGDRFFYLEESQAEHLEILAPALDETTLSSIINLNIDDAFAVPNNAFIQPNAALVIPTVETDVNGIADSLVYNTIPAGNRDVLTGLSNNVIADSDAVFDNLIGFYQITDTNGGIDTNGDGLVDLQPGDIGYARAAIVNRVDNFEIRAGSSGDPNRNTTLEQFGDVVLNGSKLYAPFVIANGGELGFDGFVNQEDGEGNEFNNAAEFASDQVAYFSFVGANPDGARHLQSFGNNVFGFEDLPSNLGISDNDFNDAVFSFNFV